MRLANVKNFTKYYVLYATGQKEKGDGGGRCRSNAQRTFGQIFDAVAEFQSQAMEAIFLENSKLQWVIIRKHQ